MNAVFHHKLNNQQINFHAKLNFQFLTTLHLLTDSIHYSADPSHMHKYLFLQEITGFQCGPRLLDPTACRGVGLKTGGPRVCGSFNLSVQNFPTPALVETGLIAQASLYDTERRGTGVQPGLLESSVLMSLVTPVPCTPFPTLPGVRGEQPAGCKFAPRLLSLNSNSSDHPLN